MTNAELSRYAGPSALVSAVASIVGLVTLIIFFSLGEPWGTINDIASVLQALSVLPVLFLLYRMHRHEVPIVSLAALATGMIGMLIAIVFQSLLIMRVITFAQTAVASPVGFGLLGIPLLWYGYRDFLGGMLPRGAALLSMLTGAGFVALIVGVLLGGQEHPLATIGGLIAGIGYPVWAIWLGRILLFGRISVETKPKFE
jgi:hypothetical protein